MPSAEETPSSSDRAVFDFGDARLTLIASDEAADSTKRGIERLVIGVEEVDAAHKRLRDAGAVTERKGDVVELESEWAGVLVEMRPLRAGDDNRAADARSVLDHVAILVPDIEPMLGRWAAITGGSAAHAGVHPLGTSVAGRFLLGDRMIEVLAPLPDGESPLRARLDRAGPGPFALAIIANDLDETVTAVSASSARLIDQPPHVVVHPSDASGVPIQLTPRVGHDDAHHG